MPEAKVLIVNDDEAIARYLREKLILSSSYLPQIELSSEAGIETFKELKSDIILINFGMPDLSTADFVKKIKRLDPDTIIIIFMDEIDPDISREMSQLGVYDFISKPINLDKLFFVLQKGAELRSLMVANRKLMQGMYEQNSALQKQNVILAKRIEDSAKNLTRLYEDLRSNYMRTIKVLAHAIDARDHYTHSHSESVARYAVAIAQELKLSIKEVELIRDACELHDLGKIAIEDKILLKPSALTLQEWIDIKRHPMAGAQILEPLSFLNGVTELVKQHHEHYDGTGYPQGLKGENIALGARIIHLADAYDTMRSARAYRKIPLTQQGAIEEIKRNRGTQFDPNVVDIFLKIADKF
ncbi:MAG: HD domain-containing phosphohydrolase [Candidatus Omnitrophota bacterium]